MPTPSVSRNPVKRRKPKMMRATQAFVLPRNKKDKHQFNRVIQKGDLFKPSDPIVKKYSTLFAPAEGRTVEEASANPGAVRKLDTPITKPKTKPKTKK